jgi:hypothetical protein
MSLPDVFSVLLIALAVVDWGATVIQLQAWQTDRTNAALGARVITGLGISFGATLVAFLALLSLFRDRLPASDGTALLMVVFLLLSVPQVNWLQLYLRRRF